MLKKNGKRNGPRLTGHIAALLLLCLVLGALFFSLPGGFTAVSSSSGGEEEIEEKEYIHWVEFGVPLEVLEQAYQYDVESHKSGGVKLNWIDLLAYTAAKNGGVFKKGKRSAAMDALVERLRSGEKLEDITSQMRYWSYYKEAYTAVLSQFVGEHDGEKDGKSAGYGLKVYSPVAKGYNFGHYDDFGNPRTYGYKRLHLGNDLCGSIGTPIIAVEGGVVEKLGWNQYGGWRVGIRSHDKLRYYYYAHLRKGSPYAEGLREGSAVRAGDVIGYMGMTGYSTKEDVNNVKVPHLHFGMQLIFDDSQIDGTNQIWIDVYNIVRFLERSRMPVEKLEEGGYIRADGLAQEVVQ
ncbi:MAG TPA: M23 family metallopeptidase [Feifaniaceae bacterium]|nr:M23 family metallopeptidase [Feifaniaceae bacterium]